ncbi:hypothetical protein ZWY2020_026189 [Hordeum vulgare]|nr:hypothetical protein ZWY2020_026189 [Hordeum vulgare]
MAAGDGSNQGTSSLAGQWSDLPDDLLSMVYIRLAFPADRVHFAAVCASWHAIASTHPPSSPPLIPWLILDPHDGDETRHLYCPHDGTVLPRVLLPSKAAGRCFIGGYDGGWVALSGAPLGIVNLFSGAQVPLSTEQTRTIHEHQCTGDILKVVFSEAPTSSGCILAAITNKPSVAICKVGCPDKGWITQELRGHKRLMDIAFCNGELYGAMRRGDRLVKFEITLDSQGAPMRIDAHPLNMKNRCSHPYLYEYPNYIVVLEGKLLMVQRTPWYCQPNVPFFRVDELVCSNSNTTNRTTYDYNWVEVTSLGDYALFLGPMCSKAMRMPTDGGGSLKRNHIYCSHRRCLRRKDRIPDGAKLFDASPDSNEDRVYYMEEESTSNNVEGIRSVRYYTWGDLHPPMWLLPPNI